MSSDFKLFCLSGVGGGRFGQVPSPAPNGRVPSPAPGDGSNPYGGNNTNSTNHPAAAAASAGGDHSFQSGGGGGQGSAANSLPPGHHRSIHSSLSTIPEVPAGMERTMINVIPPSAAGSAVDIPTGGGGGGGGPQDFGEMLKKPKLPITNMY